MNYWIEDIEQSADLHVKMLRYRPDVDHEIDLDRFSVNEREKYDAYKSAKRKLEFYFTRLLWDSFKIPQNITYKPSGKPVLPEGFISVSHSHDCIAIGFSKQAEIGIDIEPVSEKIRKVKHKFSHPKESFDDLTDLTKSWCIKEAVYKVLDMDHVFFMDDIFVETVQSPAQTTVNIEGVEIKSQVRILELPNDMIMALAY